jgi:hypothetical protein
MRVQTSIQFKRAGPVKTTGEYFTMKVIELKCDYDPFWDVALGKKKAEFRKNDRDYLPGDVLLLKQTRKNDRENYTGFWIMADIIHIQPVNDFLFGSLVPLYPDYLMISIHIFRRYIGNMSGVESVPG